MLIFCIIVLFLIIWVWFSCWYKLRFVIVLNLWIPLKHLTFHKNTLWSLKTVTAIEPLYFNEKKRKTTLQQNNSYIFPFRDIRLQLENIRSWLNSRWFTYQYLFRWVNFTRISIQNRVQVGARPRTMIRANKRAVSISVLWQPWIKYLFA